MSINRIPRDFIHALLTKIDIVELIDSRVPLQKKSNNNYFACCPFHTEKSASFSVSFTKQFYYCFGCSAHGNAIDFLMHFDRYSFPESVAALAHMAGMEIPQEKFNAKIVPGNDSLYTLMEEVAKFYQSELRQNADAIAYLKGRGLSGTIAKTFGLGLAPAGWDNLITHFKDIPQAPKQLHLLGMLVKKEDGNYYDRFRTRIMFPIHDRRGRIVGFGGRVLKDEEPKYLNSPETPLFKKSQELYGLHQVLASARNTLPKIMLVEGYLDVIALFQQGIHYAVATLGTATTSYHIQRLLRYTSEIIYCFDGDQAGRHAAERALQVTLPLIQDDLQVRFMFLPEGEDPDSLIRLEGKSAFEARIEQSLTLSQFFFQVIAAQTDLSHMDGRARFVKLAQEQLNILPDGIFKKMLLQELAHKARIDVGNLIPATSLSTQAPNPTRFRPRPPSNLRMAIQLLVQEPILAFEVNQTLSPVELPGMHLLLDLIDTIQAYSIKTTGGLLEMWRDKKEGKLLAKLANQEHMIPHDGIKSEFLGAISKLKILAQKQYIEKLLAKASVNSLTPEEKKQLAKLIQNKNFDG